MENFLSISADVCTIITTILAILFATKTISIRVNTNIDKSSDNSNSQSVIGGSKNKQSMKGL